MLYLSFSVGIIYNGNGNILKIFLETRLSMKKYIITTDSTADLPKSYIEKNGLMIMTLPYTIEGKTYTWENPLPEKEFYDMMRNGSLPTTSQTNPAEAAAMFEQILSKEDVDILHIAFSSGMSGTYNNVRLAAEEVMERHPDNRILVIDSLGATLGEGLLVHKAICLKDAGKSIEENAAWLEENKLHLVHNFTVDDLFHLYRGGRLSKTAAVVGTIINLKPVLHVDDEGHLVLLNKTRGRKKALTALVDCMEQQMGSYRDQNDVVFISHGDCLDDAQFVANLIKERFGIDSMIDYVGPTIGAHSGPGTVMIGYLGDYR
jgi:DegV family protein with EDD domain